MLSQKTAPPFMVSSCCTPFNNSVYKTLPTANYAWRKKLKKGDLLKISLRGSLVWSELGDMYVTPGKLAVTNKNPQLRLESADCLVYFEPR